MHNGSLEIILVFLLAAVIAVPLFRCSASSGSVRSSVISRPAWCSGRKD